ELTALLPNAPAGRPAWLARLGDRFSCEQCGAPLTRPLVRVELPPHKTRSAGREYDDWLASGLYAVGLGPIPYETPAPGETHDHRFDSFILLSSEDLLTTQWEGHRPYGYASASQLACSAGHVVGHQWINHFSWAPHVALRAERVVRTAF